MIRCLVPLTAVFVLAACAPPKLPEPPNLVFSGGPQFVLPAEQAAVDIVEQYEPPRRAPNVEHEFRLLPVEIARAWARDRLAVKPGDGIVRLTIEEASVVTEALPAKKGLFRNDPDRQFTGTLRVRLDYVGIAGSASAAVVAKVTKTLHQKDTLLEQEETYYALIEQLAQAFQAEMDESVRKHFAHLFTAKG